MHTTYALTIMNDRECYDLAMQEKSGYITFTEYTQRCDELYNEYHSDEELPTAQRLQIMLDCWKDHSN